jgi:hypothetical protein
MISAAQTVLFRLPKWMDGSESAVGPAEVFFSLLATAIICCAVYIPWHLRQKKSKAQKPNG